MSRPTRILSFAIARLIVLCSLVLGLSVTARVSFSDHLPPEDQPNAPTPRATVTPQPTLTPVPTPTRQPPSFVRAPILMYHYISKPPRNADRFRIDLSVAPEDFERQLYYLAANGYTTISLDDLYRHLSTGEPLPYKPVVLTFDDGYIDAYENAFPLLKQYGMTGTFFIPTDFVNNGNPNHATWSMLKEMAGAGMSIESHSRTHPDLRGRSFEFLVWEILGPIEQIEAHTGKRPRFFCYPSGKYDEAVIRMLKSVDTLAAVTTEYGSLHTLRNSMTWPRLRLHGSTTIEGFAAMLKQATQTWYVYLPIAPR
jgi:peptidoglycan/xylan/chitin deacetylase (PgdA/CDA1 family)